MTAQVLALVAPQGAPSVAPDTVLLGLPLVRRTALAARRAGFGRVVALSADRETERLLSAALEGSGAEVSQGSEAPGGSVVVAWNRVLTPADLRALSQGADPQRLGVPVVKRLDVRRAEDSLLAGAVKPGEGFLCRTFERRVSLAISRRLSATRVTPNGVTVFSAAVGVVGCLFFLFPGALLQTAGALLLLTHSVIDGCDGELARLRFEETRFGGALDFWSDNAVHCALFGALAVGWSRSAGALWPLGLGLAAILGVVFSASLAYTTMKRAPSEGPGPLFTGVVARGPGSRLANAMACRDFLYLLLALSLFGKANWLLLAAGGGAPAYGLLLLALNHYEPERTTT
jgi:phosphatidylglycerophosphate synthase